eukprot:13200388-Alexandrium_andersonii.AAC.1
MEAWPGPDLGACTPPQHHLRPRLRRGPEDSATARRATEGKGRGTRFPGDCARTIAHAEASDPGSKPQRHHPQSTASLPKCRPHRRVPAWAQAQDGQVDTQLPFGAPNRPRLDAAQT